MCIIYTSCFSDCGLHGSGGFCTHETFVEIDHGDSSIVTHISKYATCLFACEEVRTIVDHFYVGKIVANSLLRTVICPNAEVEFYGNYKDDVDDVDDATGVIADDCVSTSSFGFCMKIEANIITLNRIQFENLTLEKARSITIIGSNIDSIYVNRCESVDFVDVKSDYIKIINVCTTIDLFEVCTEELVIEGDDISPDGFPMNRLSDPKFGMLCARAKIDGCSDIGIAYFGDLLELKIEKDVTATEINLVGTVQAFLLSSSDILGANSASRPGSHVSHLGIVGKITPSCADFIRSLKTLRCLKCVDPVNVPTTHAPLLVIIGKFQFMGNQPNVKSFEVTGCKVFPSRLYFGRMPVVENVTIKCTFGSVYMHKFGSHLQSFAVTGNMNVIYDKCNENRRVVSGSTYVKMLGMQIMQSVTEVAAT